MICEGRSVSPDVLRRGLRTVSRGRYGGRGRVGGENCGSLVYAGSSSSVTSNGHRLSSGGRPSGAIGPCRRGVSVTLGKRSGSLTQVSSGRTVSGISSRGRSTAS